MQIVRLIGKVHMTKKQHKKKNKCCAWGMQHGAATTTARVKTTAKATTTLLAHNWTSHVITYRITCKYIYIYIKYKKKVEEEEAEISSSCHNFHMKVLSTWAPKYGCALDTLDTTWPTESKPEPERGPEQGSRNNEATLPASNQSIKAIFRMHCGPGLNALGTRLWQPQLTIGIRFAVRSLEPSVPSALFGLLAISDLWGSSCHVWFAAANVTFNQEATFGFTTTRALTTAARGAGFALAYPFARPGHNAGLQLLHGADIECLRAVFLEHLGRWQHNESLLQLLGTPALNLNG